MSHPTPAPTREETSPVPSPAETYESFYGPAIFEPCTRVLLEKVPPRPGQSVLDLACGTGQVARRVAPLVGSQGRVVGLDVNPRMLEVARSLPEPRGAPMEWIEGDAVSLDLANGSFDLVLCQQGLQFFPDRACALEHAHRVLGPEGRIGVAVWQGIDRHPLYAEMTEAEARHLGDLGGDEGDLLVPFSLGDEGQIAGLLEESGFSGVEIHKASIQARFPGPDTWVRNMQLAYAAVIPAFEKDPNAFETFVRGIEEDIGHLVREHVEGDEVVVPMHALIASARAA